MSMSIGQIATSCRYIVQMSQAIAKGMSGIGQRTQIRSMIGEDTIETIVAQPLGIADQIILPILIGTPTHNAIQSIISSGGAKRIIIQIIGIIDIADADISIIDITTGIRIAARLTRDSGDTAPPDNNSAGQKIIA